jgi:hypothetical protein
MIENVLAWIVGIIISVSPPGIQPLLPKHKVTEPTYITESRETESEALARYNSIAEDLVEVMYDPQTQPLFKEFNGRARSITVLLGIMKHESNFKKDVDKNIGPKARGDKGASWCMMQIKIGKGRTQQWNFVQNRKPRWGDPVNELEEGLYGFELIKDRKLCISEGYKIVSNSFQPGLKLKDKLRIYASGSEKKGGKASRERMDMANYFWNTEKYKKYVIWNDNDIVNELTENRIQKNRSNDIDKMNIALDNDYKLNIKRGFVGLAYN